MDYVIIGNGAAGIRAVEAVRRLDPAGGITLIDAEPHRCYYRMMLPDYISGLKRRDSLFLVGEGFYEENRVDFRPGTVVSAVDTASREVRLENGAAVSYDRLLVASGARPRAFTPPGSGLSGEVALRTLDQADAILGFAKSAGRAVALGGGLLGVELARSFNELGLETTYLIREDRFWPQMLDLAGSAMIERRLEEKGIDLRKEEGIAELHGEGGRLTAVETTSGAVIPAEIMGAAVGVALNVEFLQGSGIATQAGVLVDGHMRSGAEGVYAAGDAAQVYDPVHGENRVVTSMVNAQRTGRVAGANMAGGDEEIEGVISSNLITIYGLPVAGMGMNQAGGEGYEVLTGGHPDGEVYKRCVFKGGAMVGATLIGDVRDARVMERLITARADLSSIKDSILERGFDLKAAAREILGE